MVGVEPRRAAGVSAWLADQSARLASGASPDPAGLGDRRAAPAPALGRIGDAQRTGAAAWGAEPDAQSLGTGLRAAVTLQRRPCPRDAYAARQSHGADPATVAQGPRCLGLSRAPSLKTNLQENGALAPFWAWILLLSGAAVSFGGH
mgnify:CR=1 FL=1